MKIIQHAIPAGFEIMAKLCNENAFSISWKLGDLE